METLGYILGSGGVLGFIIMMIKIGRFEGRLTEKLSSMSKEMDLIRADIKETKIDVKEIKNEQRFQGERIARIEGYLTGRDFRPENRKTGT